MAKGPQFHETPKEIDMMMRRREIRQRLQQEFNRVMYNPYRIAHHIEILDPAVSRYSSMRAAIFEHWKPDWRSFWKYALLTQIPIFFLAYRTKRLFHAKDEDCRRGDVPYEMRDFRRI